MRIIKDPTSMVLGMAAIGLVHCALDGPAQLSLQPHMLYATSKVDVTIGVMSRCPDALYFEGVFSKALERVNEKIDLKLTYIASPDKSSPYGATCKNGDAECAGNIQQLCIIDALNPTTAGERYDLGPSAAQRLWWEFVQCENYVGGTKRIGEESLAKQCIKAIGGVPDWNRDGIEECARGKKGKKLLKESIKNTRKLQIINSATLLIEGKVACIRDDGKWRECSAGHEASDWIHQIEDAFRRKNPSLNVLESPSPTSIDSSTSEILWKRQQAPPGPPGNGTTSTAPGAGPSTGNNGQQGAPLSVFATTRRLLKYPSFFFVNLVSSIHEETDENLDRSSLLLQPRHGASYNSTTSADPNPLFGGSFPTAYLAFGLVAIALFVLVVSFVLLRIFVRNRRLRRMGIYPEGPIDRFLGGTIREYEDTLAPPRLWEAKIADVYTDHDGSTDVKTEKGTSSWESRAGGNATMQRGWDGLMPISAALPPNLYPIIFENTDQQTVNTTEGSNTYPPNNPASRIALHMPQFLRRHTGEGGDGTLQNSTATPAAAAAISSNGHVGISEPTSAVTSAHGDRNDERLAASVNVTVLIAMPSPRTVLPSSRRGVSSLTTKTGPIAKDPLQEMPEDRDIDADASSLKGKAKRAPSLRSVKSTMSTKSVAEARRGAFFAQDKEDDAKSHPSMPATESATAPAYDSDEEEKELPELMFGTASVPIFTRSLASAAAPRGYLGSSTTGGRLSQPNRSDILSLVAAASRAREKKAEAEKAAEEKAKKQEETEARRSVAETSIEGEGRSAITPTLGSQDRSTDTQAPLGDVATRMMRQHNVNEGFEMTDLRSSNLDSRAGESSAHRSGLGAEGGYDLPTPSTTDPLLFRMGSTAGANTPNTQGNDYKGAYPPLTPAGEATTPISSVPLAFFDEGRYSNTSFHTGTDGEGAKR